MSGPFGFVIPAATIGLGAVMLRPRRGFFPFNAEGEALAPIIAQAVIEEHHRDELVITEHPVETGASIADHAYKLPAEVTILMGWSNSPSGPGSLIGQAVGVGAAIAGNPVGAIASLPSTIRAAQSVLAGNSQDQLKQIYQNLLQLQADRVPFDVYTGKRVYRTMLLRSLVVETDKNRENVLWVRAQVRQVLLVETQTVTVPNNPAAMQDPKSTLKPRDVGSVQLGPAPTMTPDATTITGTLKDLQNNVATTQQTLTGIVGDPGGAIGQLSGVLGSLQGTVTDALGKLPTPFEIPTLPSTPQSFSIQLGSADLTGEQEGALLQLNSTLTTAQGVVTDATRQIPGAAGIPDALKGQLDGVQKQISSSFDQIKRVMP